MLRSPAFCPYTQTLPQTLTALRDTGPLTALGQHVEPLALAGTMFENAMITTQNQGALVAARGGYGALQSSNTPLRLSQSPTRADLRFDPCVPARILRTDGGIAVLDRHDRVQHRVQLPDPADQVVATCLAEGVHDAPPSDPVGNVINLIAIRTARAQWDHADAGQHLNDLLHDRGQTRRTCLRHLGPNRAWRVRADVLPSFLAYLIDRKTAFARMVIGDGLLQADTGRLAEFGLIGQIVTLRDGARSFALDISQITSAWITVSGRHWQIETYDPDTCATVVLAADPTEDQSQWRDYLCSLPRAC